MEPLIRRTRLTALSPPSRRLDQLLERVIPAALGALDAVPYSQLCAVARQSLQQLLKSR